ncbi:PilZ domain-containing protein [Vibrio aquimaris]|uniref:Cyclic di-GMP binding protein n=1 Tax=Vibrio aquimaris TaxID=2587862 RepID=A0A5P9CQM3_9VIBR|nr:PilZ domain-containing protein [Vibrio aquimaris]QFT28538.1 Cyclic di-GMP binding protein [Vibrio aquimaris]
MELKEEDHSERLSNPSSEKGFTSINSTDALAMLEHGGELTVTITTPVGRAFSCKTLFIGAHSHNLILAELPNLSLEDTGFFFQSGFWATIRAISPRGEGALVSFKTQLEYVLHSPIPIVAFNIPNIMQVNQLRREPRYNLDLPASVKCQGIKMECQMRDLSVHGCRFVTSPLSKAFQASDEITVCIHEALAKKHKFQSMTGHVRNSQSSIHYASYGVEFDEKGIEGSKLLLSKLKFSGNKLILR